MIIHEPETKRENGVYEVSAQVEFEKPVELPDRMWFRVREELAPRVAVRSDLFASSLVRVARILGEDIEVRGVLSPQLMFGLREYIKLHDVWAGKEHHVEIKAQQLVPSSLSSQVRGVSCNISGGIDSFYTLWSQLPQNEPVEELQVRYGIFGDGLSSPDRSAYISQSYLPKIEKLLAGMGIELWVVDTNLADFGLPKHRWLALSVGRIALPQLFSPHIGIHFSPSSITYDTLRSWGASPLSDHLFSLESLKVFTHTPELIRYEKLRQIADWPPLHDHLQVCNAPRGDVLNDCTCNKCVRTMSMLYVLGKAEPFTVFHLPFKRRRLLRRMLTASNQYRDFKMMVRQAAGSGKWAVIPFLLVPMLLYRMVTWLQPFLGQRFE